MNYLCSEEWARKTNTIDLRNFDVLEFYNSGNIDVTELLIKSGANISIHGKYGETPTDLAKAYGRLFFSEKLKKRSIWFQFLKNFRQSRNCKSHEGR